MPQVSTIPEGNVCRTGRVNQDPEKENLILILQDSQDRDQMSLAFVHSWQQTDWFHFPLLSNQRYYYLTYAINVNDQNPRVFVSDAAGAWLSHFEVSIFTSFLIPSSLNFSEPLASA